MFEKINVEIPLLFDEPMADHCSFRVGGPADLFVEPSSAAELMRIYTLCAEKRIPRFLLGEGANILVSDAGIEGAVISTGALRGVERKGDCVAALAGTSLSRVAEAAADWNLGGLETFYSMPGSVGGSIWINARCYGVSLSERLQYVDIYDASSRQRGLTVDPSEYGYKKSPFQGTGAAILRGEFRLNPADGSLLKKRMAGYREDRAAKGHFLHPCAGSVFKNDRRFGMPTGKIIDSLGMRGMRCGGAMVSPAHANIIVNTGTATAGEVWQLTRLVKQKVREATGHLLEEEIIRVGRWEDFDV